MSAPSSAQTFKDRIVSARLTAAVHTNGVSVADYDSDGDLDVYFVAVKQYDAIDPQSWNRLYLNNRDGTFSDVTQSAGVAGLTGPEDTFADASAVWWDFDLDGDVDLYVESSIRFEVANAGTILLELYDITGRRLRILTQGYRPAGNHEVRLEALNLPAGSYIYRLTTSGGVLHRVMTLYR